MRATENYILRVVLQPTSGRNAHRASFVLPEARHKTDRKFSRICLFASNGEVLEATACVIPDGWLLVLVVAQVEGAHFPLSKYMLHSSLLLIKKGRKNYRQKHFLATEQYNRLPQSYPSGESLVDVIE